MRRPRATRTLLAAAALLATMVAPPASAAPPARAALVDGLRVPARVQGGLVRPAVDGAFVPRFWAGVNLGSTVPGTQPGEVAPTRRDYDRWLAGMGAMGVDVLRIYTILRPGFYDALRAYNLAHPGREIWVVHGVWIPEERFLETRDLYDPEVVAGFRAEIADAVAVVHGDATLPVRRGHAGGRYASDISPWLLAWSPGVEWDPEATADSDRANAGTAPYTGRFVTATQHATPTESWIASMLDHLASLEAARGWSRPVTFTNWLTVDPLRHASEPMAKEDMVSVDAMHLRATAAWPGGFFASYHAYPYYPDFLRLQPEYVAYRRARDGARDSYAGYLADLRRHHRGQAVMITEFGVPTSLGLAHRGPDGRDQGGHSERDAARINADLLRDIRDEGYAGGILFEWTDEWFKFTWNTIEYELPGDRRQLWRNPLTNEEHFGVIAMEPGRTDAAVLDGRDAEWTRTRSQSIAESRGPVSSVRAIHDAEYLYLRLRTARPRPWGAGSLVVGLDTRPGGNRGIPGRPGVAPQADVALTVGPGDRAVLRQAAWSDPIAVQYGRGLALIPFDRAALRPASGAWARPRLMLNRPYVVPSTGERRAAELVDVGAARWGPTDPSAAGFDDRNLVMGAGHVLEIRLPWSLLGMADPSGKRLLVPRPDGTFTTSPARRIGIVIAAPGGAPLRTAGYDWEGWNRVTWHERRKAGFALLTREFADLGR
ncbi:MAG: hypothetical protein AB1416_04070 [Actinomycetota bacterium]